ncbi:hypothetical protein PIB30_015576 [Stylosanthes scabra]|uniref:AAA+ ATPase domain-containing protein n=1 Tax=Stylosanthes scabra TaxID=79078 RepID=A0ABU6Q771_9FABA|nr:hypothetical protein [Stylosanthes scabra]
MICRITNPFNIRIYLLRRSISRGELRCIGATTLEEYHKHIDNDPTLARSFSPVYVDQSTVGETISILKGLRQNYEQYHGIKFSDGALETAAVLSDQHITGKFLPAKVIELIDIAAAKVNIQTVSKHIGSEKGKLILDSEMEKLSVEGSSEQVIVTDDDIVEVVSQTTKIPKEKLKESEEQKLLHLESEMRKRVVGQVHALKEVIAVVRRSRVGLGNPKRPAASFMFVGPAGVGKTKLAKALAYSLFNTEEALVRFDLSSFHQGGQLIEAVRRRPYSVILLDGIDKAPPELLEVLFVILDEGKIMDAAGRLVNFTNTVIILTSNIAPVILLQDPDNKTNKLSYDHLKDKVLSELQLQPELLNRVDESIVFLPLDPDDANHLVRLKVATYLKLGPDGLIN